MAITIIVEDGSIVAGANSFLSLIDARALAESLGLSLPLDDDEANTALVQGGQYVNNQESSLQGTRVSALQTMCEPRDNVVRYGFAIDNDVVPEDAKCAQVNAAVEIGAGLNPYGNDTGKEVKLQEVTGAVKREFFETGKTDTSISITSVENCLFPISNAAIGGGNQFTVRGLRA